MLISNVTFVYEKVIACFCMDNEKKEWVLTVTCPDRLIATTPCVLVFNDVQNIILVEICVDIRQTADSISQIYMWPYLLNTYINP